MIKQTEQKAINYKFDYGSESIECLIHFDQQERLKITVHPDQAVVVKAPSGKPLSQVIEKVKRRAGWILKQLHYFEQFMPRLPKRNYIGGESFYYLGRQYRLKVIQDEIVSVKLIGRFLCIRTQDKDNTKRIKTLLDIWFREHASLIFARRIDVCHQLVARYGICHPIFKLKNMQRRWGSCIGSDSILLNTQLVRAPIRCIDYVIIHELCHLKHPSHSEKFYRLLSRVLPDWKERKERLEHVSL